MLAWEDVSAGGVVTSDLWGGDMVATTVVVFSEDDCLDLQLDVSAIAWVRRLSTSAAMLHLGPVEDLGGMVSRMMEALPIARAFVSNSLLSGDVNLKIGVLIGNDAFTAA